MDKFIYLEIFMASGLALTFLGIIRSAKLKRERILTKVPSPQNNKKIPNSENQDL